MTDSRIGTEHARYYPGTHLYKVPPGETLNEFLTEHTTLTSETVADLLGLSDDELQNLLTGDLRITEDLAVGLYGITGISVGMWVRLEANYREALRRG